MCVTSPSAKTKATPGRGEPTTPNHKEESTPETRQQAREDQANQTSEPKPPGRPTQPRETPREASPNHNPPAQTQAPKPPEEHQPTTTKCKGTSHPKTKNYKGIERLAAQKFAQPSLPPPSARVTSERESPAGCEEGLLAILKPPSFEVASPVPLDFSRKR